MRLVNLTRFPAQDLVLLDRDGDEWLVVIAKVTAELRSARPAADQATLALADRYDAHGVLIVPADVALERTGTSVLCEGTIVAEPASCAIGSWSLSFARDAQTSAHALEPLPRDQSPRLDRAGTYDARWAAERAPLVPEDFDPRAQDVAPDDAVIRPALRGGEPVRLENVGVPGEVCGALPRLLFRVTYGDHILRPEVDIVRLRPADDRVSLTLRFVCGPLIPDRHERAVLRELNHRPRSGV